MALTRYLGAFPRDWEIRGKAGEGKLF